MYRLFKKYMKDLPEDDDTNVSAREHELEGDLKTAAKLYEKEMKATSIKLPILKRLMIIYRKLKMYRQELVCINHSIRIHEQQYQPSKKANFLISNISDKLNKLFGYTDKKGRHIMPPEEIRQLEQRKTIVLKKMNA